LSPILFNLHSEYLTNTAVEGFGHFGIGGQIICTVDDFVLLDKQIDIPTDIERCYGMK
jgi:hypothetical protein